MRGKGKAVIAAAVAAVFGISAVPTSAATWDGGDGTWQVGVGSWDGGGTWSNGTSAVFPAGGSGTLTLGGDISVTTMSFEDVGYTINLNGFNFSQSGDTGGTSIPNSGNIISNSSVATSTYSLSATDTDGTIGLQGNINVVYSGTLWSPAVNNTFTGSLSINGNSTVNTFAGPSALGSASKIHLNGSAGQTPILIMNASAQVPTTYTRDIEINVSTARVGASDRFIIHTGTISGGQLNMNGTTGALVLAGNNTFTGRVTVPAGGPVLLAGHANAFGAANADPAENVVAMGGNSNTVGFFGGADVLGTKNITTSAGIRTDGLGAIVNLGGDNSFAGNISIGNNQIHAVEEGSQLTLKGVWSGSRSIGKMGGGTLVLTNQNTVADSGGNGQFRQLASVSEGKLLLDFSQAGAVDFDILNPTHAGTSAIAALRGGTIEVKGSPGEANSQYFTSGFRVDGGDSSFVITKNGATSVGVRVGSSVNRTIGGTVDFTLPEGTQTNWTTNGTGNGFTFTRANVNGIIGGYATVGRNDWATNSSSNIVAYTHTANEQSANAFDTASHNVDVNSSNFAPAADRAVNSVRFNETAALALSGDNTLSSGGILVTSAGSGSSITGGTITSGTTDIIVNQNGSSFELASTIVDAPGPLAVGLTKSGTGRLILSGSNTYTGETRVNNGVLLLDNPNALPGGTAFAGGTSKLIIDGGVVGLTGDFSRGVSTGVAAAPDKVQWLSSGGFAAYGGTHTVNLGSQSWDSGTFSGSNSAGEAAVTASYSGGFVPTHSKLVLGAADADGTVDWVSNINLGSVGFSWTRTIEVVDGPAAVEARLAGVVSGSGMGITKTGGGTLELTGKNTYSGETIVAAGRLLVNGDGVDTGVLAADSFVTVKSGATLGGSGAINGPITIDSGGTISPGVTVESLNVGSLSLAAGSTALFEIAGIAGGEFDTIIASGAVAFGGTLAVDFSQDFGEGSWDLFEFASSSGDFSSIVDISGTYSNYILSFDPAEGILTASVIPEPASLGLLALGSVMMLRRRRMW